MRWRKAAILGVGLLGGSLGLALRRGALAGEVAGLVRREASATEVLAAGAADYAGTDLRGVVDRADLVVFCTPLAQMAPIAERLSGLLAKGACVTDVGSAKAAVLRNLEGRIAAAGGAFVGSHPMAGSERTGVSAARADLFRGALTVITPTPASDPAAVTAVQELWESVGSRTLRVSAECHDAWVGRTSHLPHLVAAALAHAILAPEHGEAQQQLCATGFRDTTRVASGSPEMWRDIVLANRGAILDALSGFRGVLDVLREAVESGDAARIDAFLRTAKERRDGWNEGDVRYTGE